MGIVVRSTSSPPSHPPPPQTSSAASLIDDEGWGSSAPDSKGGEGEGEVLFLQKGADAVMARIVGRNDWLDEECANFAREGLRTLVVGRRKMGRGEYGAFEQAYRTVRAFPCYGYIGGWVADWLDGLGQASVATDARSEKMAGVVAQYLERDLELLGLTGVEDKLQEDVRYVLSTSFQLLAFRIPDTTTPV